MRTIKFRVWEDPYNEGFAMNYDYRLHNEPGFDLNSMLRSHKDQNKG